MKSGKYSLKELFTHNEIDQLVIPELQRDYVWSKYEVEKVWNSFYTKFKEIGDNSFHIENNNSPIKSVAVVKYLEKTYNILTHKAKMGFVYAYHDKEMPGKFFLIDGQQRLTTFYLVLLAIYTKLGEVDKFKKLYYNSGLPKIDYKVRESAYEFLRLFIDETLNGRDFHQSLNFFSNDYRNDTTVANIINNYRFITEKVNEAGGEFNELLDYVENYIEFNYFDTKLSAQGERLYLYMNSRGFHLSHQEKLRANLIEKEPKEKKKAAGKLWEDWQNFFFEHKYQNENADKGFEDFLYLSSLLKKQGLGELTASDFNAFEDLKEFQIKELTIDFLAKVFTSLKATLFWNRQEEVYFDDFFVALKNDKQEYVLKLLFRYLPVWYYHLKFFANDVNASFQNDLNLFRLFVLNQSHTRQISDQPSQSLINMLGFVDGFKTAAILNYESEVNSFNIRYELPILKLSKDDLVFFDFIHKLYFDYNFQSLLEGRTDILLKIAKIDLPDNFNYKRVSEVIKILKILFFTGDDENNKLNLSDKFLRRFILTYFDYGEHLGNSYGQPRYNLISDNRSWLNRVINNDKFIVIVDDWLISGKENLIDKFEINKQIFVDEFDWRYYFIHYNKVIDHTRENHFVGSGVLEDTILLNKTYQSGLDCYLPIKLLEYFNVYEINFRQYLLKTAYIDITTFNDVIMAEYEAKPRLALDLIYQTKGIWYLDVFYKDFISDKLFVLKDNGFEQEENGRWRNKLFFEHNTEISLKQNLFNLVSLVKEIIVNLKGAGLIPAKELKQ